MIVFAGLNQAVETDVFQEDEPFSKTMEEFLRGKSLLVPKYRVLSEAIVQGKRVKREDILKVYRALRQVEIGIAPELADWVEEHRNADWIAFGTPEGECADLAAWEV